MGIWLMNSIGIFIIYILLLSPPMHGFILERREKSFKHFETNSNGNALNNTSAEKFTPDYFQAKYKDDHKLGEEYIFQKYFNHEIKKLGDRSNTERSNNSIHSVDDIMSSIKSDIKNVEETISRDKNKNGDEYLDSFYVSQANQIPRLNLLEHSRLNSNIINLNSPKSLYVQGSKRSSLTVSGSQRSRVKTTSRPNILAFFKQESKKPFIRINDGGIFSKLDDDIYFENSDEIDYSDDTFFHEGSTSNKRIYNDDIRNKLAENKPLNPVHEINENFLPNKREKTLQEIRPSNSTLEYLEDPLVHSGDMKTKHVDEEGVSYQPQDIDLDELLASAYRRKIVGMPKNSSFGGKQGADGNEIGSLINSSYLPATESMNKQPDDEINQPITDSDSYEFIDDILQKPIVKERVPSDRVQTDHIVNDHGLSMHKGNIHFPQHQNLLTNSNVNTNPKPVLNMNIILRNVDIPQDHEIKFNSIKNNGYNKKNVSCMDGTSPGYYLRKGWDDGTKKWIVHLHGGAWCYDLHSCSKRRGTILGSTKNSATEDISSFFHGILSKNAKVNPRFYNWNVAVLSYCDGGLFSGNRNKYLVGKGKNFYFQGRRILELLIEDLKLQSLDKATDVILSGTSAGGLAIALQGDFIRSFIPKDVHVRGLIDAGVFLDQASALGNHLARQQFKALYSLHKPILNKDCLTNFSKKNKFLCLFPENTIKYLKLPIFIVNALYDHWQLSELEGVHCVYDDEKCGTKQHDHILNFRNHMYGTLAKVKEVKNDTGVFANSCLAHGQAIVDYTWAKVKISNSSIQESFSKWFNDKELDGNTEEHFEADCKYPCNGSCPRVLAQRCVRNFKGASESRRRRDAELC